MLSYGYRGIYLAWSQLYRQPSQPQELEFFQELFVLYEALYLFEESKLREKFSLIKRHTFV
jgi:hypothetical protein